MRMSKVDVNEYKEVAAHALNILQDIMNSPVANDTAKAIAATTVLEHCKSVIERERQKKACKANIEFGFRDNVDQDIIHETIIKCGSDVAEAIKVKGVIY